MRKAKVYNFGIEAGILEETEKGKSYKFVYNDGYNGPPVSLTLPVEQKEFSFNGFPSYFDGLLPEGNQLESLIRQTKTDRGDHFSHLVIVGKDLVGSVTVEEIL
ncbi:MAG: HipA N-terminal domain-containing protein [Bacteroidetes bacterium]|nr:HipA N-terminal domain-containing protein [Bacteroidota bacterium]MCL6100720.1 HipA N-terminal domain-containing protein [Bacteroidota bacterium]